MRAGDAYHWTNKAAGTLQFPDDNHPNLSGPLTLQGGTYQIVLHCTGTPALAFQQLSADGQTWVPMYVVPDAAPATPINSVVTSDAFNKVTCPPGQYRFVIGTSTANYLGLTRIPTAE